MLFLALFIQASVSYAQQKLSANADPLKAPTWISDNGNGTFTNPLFYDEFSDPDMIRVGDDYYLTGTTMHAIPACQYYIRKILLTGIL